jgi:hypothetical protein
MNHIVARLARGFADAARDARMGIRRVQAEIFRHPDFERLAMGEIYRDELDDRAR